MIQATMSTCDSATMVAANEAFGASVLQKEDAMEIWDDATQFRRQDVSPGVTLLFGTCVAYGVFCIVDTAETINALIRLA